MRKLTLLLTLMVLSISVYGEVRKDSTITFEWQDTKWNNHQKMILIYSDDFSSTEYGYSWKDEKGWGSPGAKEDRIVNKYDDLVYRRIDHLHRHDTFNVFIQTIDNTYDNNEKLNSQVLITHMSDNIDTTQILYSYEHNNLIQKLYQDWNGSGWINSRRDIYNYENNDLIEEIMERWIDEEWETRTKTTNSYSNNKISQSILESGDSYKFMTTYNYINDKIDFVEYEQYNNDIWEKVKKDIYFWDNDLHVEILYQDWDRTEYINRSKEVYYCNTSILAINEINSTPQSFSLSNYPNPFNPETNISFELPSDQIISLKIFDIQGKLITTLTEKKWTAGIHSIVWNGKNKDNITVPSGIYIYMLESSDYKEAKRCLLVK